jgi:small subunit ribosomal protein S15
MITVERKNAIVADFRTHETDSGSLELQVALLTERINDLNKHFAVFPKDNHSRTGLMKLVGRRRKFLDYLHKSDKNKYAQLIERLGIRK